MTEPAAAASVSAYAEFTGVGESMRLRTTATPEPAAGQVRVRVTCCTICGSDLHTYEGRRGTPVPTILGHEIIGVVEAVGGTVIGVDGEPVGVGDRVTWSVAASCGACFFCTRSLPQKCERLFKYGHEKITPGHVLSGGLAERCLLAAGTAIMKLPADVPDVVACPINCATATVAAALRLSELVAGETIVVQGLGMLGLTAAAMASAAGAADVVACDVSEERLALARDFGVTCPINVSGNVNAGDIVRSLTAGRGADVAVELSGAAASVEAGVDLLRTGGRYVLVGSVSKSRDVAINPETLVRRMLTIRGLHNYGPADLAAAVRFIAANHRRFPFAKLVDRVFPLADAEAAFRHAVANHSLRVAVRAEGRDPVG